MKINDFKKQLRREVADNYGCPESMVKIKTLSQYYDSENKELTKAGTAMTGCCSDTSYVILVDLKALAYKVAKELGTEVIEP